MKKHVDTINWLRLMLENSLTQSVQEEAIFAAGRQEGFRPHQIQDALASPYFQKLPGGAWTLCEPGADCSLS